MKSTALACVLVSVLAAARVDGAPQGRNVEEEEDKPQADLGHPFPKFDDGPLRRIWEQPKNATAVEWARGAAFNRSGLAGPGGLPVSSFYNTLLSGVHSLYQDLLNRQQAFINLLTCGNCVNEGWNAIMEVALSVPELEWVYKPSGDAPATFFTAVHQNGTVTGIGGSVVNDKPVAEYAFGNDGIVHHLPSGNKKN